MVIWLCLEYQPDLFTDLRACIFDGAPFIQQLAPTEQRKACVLFFDLMVVGADLRHASNGGRSSHELSASNCTSACAFTIKDAALFTFPTPDSRDLLARLTHLLRWLFGYCKITYNCASELRGTGERHS